MDANAKTSMRLCQEQRRKSEAERLELLKKIRAKLDDPAVPEDEKESLRRKLERLSASKAETPIPKCSTDDKEKK